MHISGGRVSTVINGVAYSARGEITISGSGVEITDGANSDGSGYVTIAPKTKKAELTFDRFVDQNGTLLIWNEDVMLQKNLSVTFIEQDGGKTHLLTNASWVGTPSENLSTGEVTGLSLASDKYRAINN